jgi:hypothetical protein
MKAKFYIPYKNGQPDLTEEETDIVITNNVGFSAIGNVEANPEGGKIPAFIYAPENIIEQMKTNTGRFEFIAEVEA